MENLGNVYTFVMSRTDAQKGLDMVFTVDFTKLWPRQLRGWLGIWEL
jgi:hypothetical protein